jgi:hypothetical protein
MGATYWETFKELLIILLGLAILGAFSSMIETGEGGHIG